MYYKHQFGRLGENISTDYLIKKGYKIIDKNFLCRQGEIDIIAVDKNEIVFIEVKTRTSLKYGNPIEAINKNKIKHIYNTAKYYLHINSLQDKFVRFDVIEIYITNKTCYIKHHVKII